jgi:hypothetical protein
MLAGVGRNLRQPVRGSATWVLPAAAGPVRPAPVTATRVRDPFLDPVPFVLDEFAPLPDAFLPDFDPFPEFLDPAAVAPRPACADCWPVPRADDWPPPCLACLACGLAAWRPFDDACDPLMRA